MLCHIDFFRCLCYTAYRRYTTFPCERFIVSRYALLSTDGAVTLTGGTPWYESYADYGRERFLAASGKGFSYDSVIAVNADAAHTTFANRFVPADDQNCEFWCVDGTVYAKSDEHPFAP